MSRWHRERILAWMSPRAVVIARQRRGLSASRIVAHRERDLTESRPGRNGSSCVAALEAELELSGWGGRRLSIAISDHFVRYATLPWRRGLRTRAEWDAYAAHELEARYGALHDQEIRIASAPAGGNRIAAAVDAAFLQALREMAVRRGLRILGVEPNACRVANHFRRQFGRCGHLLIAEPNRVTWLSLTEDRWTDMVSVRNADGSALAPLAMSVRMRAGLDSEADTIWVWGPFDAVDFTRASIVRLEPAASTLAACSALGLL